MLTFYMYTTDNHTATVAIMSKVSNVNDVKITTEYRDGENNCFKTLMCKSFLIHSNDRITIITSHFKELT